MYNAHKEILLSRLVTSSHVVASDSDNKPRVFSYVTGPLEYARNYTVKLTAVNNNGLLGNYIQKVYIFPKKKYFFIITF